MAIDFGNIDWGGLLKAGLNAYGASQNAGANQQAANTYAQQTKFNPYNVVAGNQGVLFNGNSALASLSQPYQNLQGQLTSGASGLLGGIGAQYQNGGINPQLQGSFDQYNNSAPQNSQDLSGQFNASAQGFLGGLGSFDPNQAAQSYSNNLRQQAAPGNQLAAENLAQGLFNSGRLGSTGGQGLYGQLVNQQNQQDLGFQIAGQQYGGQEQSRLAGLAGQQAQLGSQFGQQQYDQTNARAQARFQNAMSLFGAGQQNLQGQLQGGLGLLQGSQGLDQGLLQAIQTGGYLGGASSSANQQAYNPSMQANVAGNNASSAGWLGIAQSLGLPDMLGGEIGKLLGGGSGGTSGGSNGATGSWAQLPNEPTIPQGFNGAGGQATNSAGGFLGGMANLPNGLQDLDYSGLQNAPLSQLGVNPNMLGNSGSGLDLNKAISGAGNVAGIYQGVKQGDAAGYLGAANSAAGLVGKKIPGAEYAGIINNIVKGNYTSGGSSYAGLGMDLAGLYTGGISTAGNVAASLINKSFTGHGDENRNFAAWEGSTGAKLITVPVGRTAISGYSLGGKLLDDGYAKDVAGAYYGMTQAPDGDREGWTKKYTDLIANPEEVKLPKGYTWDGTKVVKGF